MGLNDITLTPAALAGLYPDSLVADPTGSPTAAPAPPVATGTSPVMNAPVETGFRSLGDNKKYILVLVTYVDVVHLPDETLTFLTNMLVACKLSLADVAVVNLHNHPDATLKTLQPEFQPRIVLMFDIAPARLDLAVNFPPFQVQTLAGNTFLYAPSLEECRDDKLIKSKLWVSLQRVFGIK